MLQLVLALAVCAAALVSGEAPPPPQKHEQHVALGAFGRVSGVEEVQAMPPPQTFFRSFVEPGRPVIIQGAVLRQWAAIEKWTDAYLINKVGAQTVLVEAGEAGGADEPMELRTFMEERLRAADAGAARVFMTVPKALMGDLSLPSEYQALFAHVHEPLMWVTSRGGLRSHLHAVDRHNLFCQVAGHTDMVLVAPEEAAKLSQDEAAAFEHGYARIGIDADRVEMPEDATVSARDLRTQTAAVAQGDCLFVPSKWFHVVRSSASPSTNVGVGLWFHAIDDASAHELRAEPMEAQSGIPFSDMSWHWHAGEEEDEEGEEDFYEAEFQDRDL